MCVNKNYFMRSRAILHVQFYLFVIFFTLIKFHKKVSQIQEGSTDSIFIIGLFFLKINYKPGWMGHASK